jgi:outer membrane protein TolC
MAIITVGLYDRYCLLSQPFHIQSAAMNNHIPFLNLTSKLLLLLLFILLTSNLKAQTNLPALKRISYKEAIEQAMEQNLSIKLAKNEAEIAQKENTPGNAGMLPVVDLSINRSFTSIDIEQKLASGLEVNRRGAGSNTLNAHLGIKWNLFDGMRMFATRQRLRELEAMGQLNLIKEVNAVVLSVTEHYFQLVALHRQMEFIKGLITASAEREKLAKLRFETGMSPKTEWLQAQIDLREQQIALEEADVIYRQVQLRLGQIIAPGSELVIQPDDSILLEPAFDYNAYKSKINSTNPEVLMARKNFIITKLAKRELIGRQLPTLSIEPGYNFARTKSEAGFLLANQTAGPVLGFGLHIPIFNGYELGNALKIADLQSEKAQIQLAELENIQLTAFQTIAETHRKALLLASLQAQNVQTGKELDMINQERLRQNQITSVEYRMAQTTLLQAQSKLFQALYEAKVAEVSLMLLGGESIGQITKVF